MPKNEIVDAIEQICEEKNISYESVIETIQQALSAAYRKDFGEKNQNIKCEFHPETGKIRVFDVKTVVEDLPPEELSEDLSLKVQGTKEEARSGGEKKDKARRARVGEETKKTSERPSTSLAGEEPEEEKRRFNPRTEIQLSDARAIKKSYKVGDEIKKELDIPDEFGRMAAQTAKQVIIQRLREAERNTLYQEYKGKEGQVLSGVVQRQEGTLVLIDLGNITAILPSDQQVAGENYNSGQRYRIYLMEVRESSRGPEIVVSRTHPEIVRQLFTIEVPEIASGTVEIKAISREAGSRSKVAVATSEENIDPIGSCVGQRGTRIQTIINELGGEKIDIIEYNEEPMKFISNALSPAKVASVELKEKERTAKVKVKPDQLSLAIGKAGQNVRLAAKLTGWRIDIEGVGQAKKAKEGEKGAGEGKKAGDTGDEKGSEKETKKLRPSTGSGSDENKEIKDEDKNKSVGESQSEEKPIDKITKK